MRHLRCARDVSSRRNTGFPIEGDLYGNGVPIGVVRVTSLKARMGEPSTGRRGTGGSARSSHAVREMRKAKVALSVTCRLEATGLTTGERSDTETVTLRSERGDWKRAIARWYLASRLLNLDRPFRKTAFKRLVCRIYASFFKIN